MFDLTNAAAPGAVICPSWCDREHRGDQKMPGVVVHESVASEQETADGLVSVRLVWEQQTGADLSEPPYVEVRCWFGMLQLEPERVGDVIAALIKVGAPAWLVADLADAAAALAPSAAAAPAAALASAGGVR
jgi:hypothetical protein